MKKYLKRIVCSLISLATVVSGMTAFAADTMQIDWHGDYSDNGNPKLVVTFISPAPYKQQVTAVIYDADVADPTFNDYVRMDEVTVKGSAETEMKFYITDAFAETDGAYKIGLQGSGYLKDNSEAVEPVYVINRSKVGTLLTAFTTSNESAFKAALDEVMLPLQLEDESDPLVKTDRIKTMIAMRDNGFGGRFATLEDVREIWKVSDVLVYIKSASATAAGLKEKLVENAGLLGINVNDADFKDNADTVCSEILENAGIYNNGNGVQSILHIQDIVGESLGTVMVNTATEETIDDAFAKYFEYFDFDSTKETTYNSFPDSKKGVVLRYLYNKNFANAAALVSAFNAAVEVVAAGGGTDTPPIVIVPGIGGGTGTGSSISGGPSAPSVPTTPTTPTGFKDVPSSHWAYSYVMSLAEKGIISGYDDDTFRPNNNVTRAEFVKMIVGATGLYDSEAECEFTDVPADAWHYKYIASAFVNEIVNGVDEERFGVNENITRQDVAVIAARILKRLNAEIPEVGGSSFTDADAISDYAKDSVDLLSEMGIVNGFDDGSFGPQGALTRAEAAAIIKRLISIL